jgi:predicted glutamate--cysteine ligase
VVGLSHRAKAALKGFQTEPDCRNTEFATHPHREYESLKDEFIGDRHRLRQFVKTLGDYTLIPGGALSLGDTSSFQISDPDNEYYKYIRDAYGTNVVTASTHISIGVSDPEDIIRVYRVLRCEAALFLAMTAASPWLDGKATGFHSTRWHIFPRTPPHVPLFARHEDYTAWVEEKLRTGEMQNHRHLWVGARPNGDDAPRSLNRVELRICDRISHPVSLLGVVAFLEARISHLIEQTAEDPLSGKRFSETELLEMVTANEQAVSRSSLDAEVVRWSDGKRLGVREWVEELLQQVLPLATAGGYDAYLDGVTRILEKGSIAKRWLDREAAGESIQEILIDAIHHAEECDIACANTPCEMAFEECADE